MERFFLFPWGVADSTGSPSPLSSDSLLPWDGPTADGAVVFLLRQGESAPGIVARGVLQPEGLQLREVRPDCVAGLLPWVLLQKVLPGTDWATGAVVELDAGSGRKLDELWEEGRGRHSLAQYADWSRQDPEDRQEDWRPRYQSTVDWMRQLDADGLDAAALGKVWKDAHNGICSVKPGVLSNVEFAEQNWPLLIELTRAIQVAPDAATYQKVMERWQTGVEEKRLSNMKRAVIHRVFAGFAPWQYTSVVSPDTAQNLLRHLRGHFLFDVALSGDWVELNAELQRCVREAGLVPGVENNIVLWQLWEAFSDAAQQHSATASPDIQFPMKEEPMTATPLNQILYGPPGTGKTFNTINKALDILDPAFLAQHDQDKERAVLKRRFDELVEAGRIAFTTFHQSFSYEDFVEGLRAKTEDGQLSYAVEDGVFKELCERAHKAVVDSGDVFGQAVQRLAQLCDEAPDDRLLLHTMTGKPFEIEYEGKNFRAFPKSSPKENHPGFPHPFDQVRQMYFGSNERHYDPAYLTYGRGMLNYLKQHCGLPDAPPKAVASADKPRYVLIIDEINRGNVSRIFGELITLIEPSKRAGADEALEAVLPYSKTRFSVPDNVYLIGTMNTADRSLAGLDLALRRRFSFTEMPPRPELLKDVVVEGVNIGQMLEVINQRIVVLLNRDHVIGHAYFMPLQQDPSLKRLAAIFRNAILPLLQEYFFEDWQRIRWVLNDHRKAQAYRFIVEDKALDVDALFGDLPELKQRQQCWTLNDKAFGQVESYASILRVQATKTNMAVSESSLRQAKVEELA